MGASVRISLRQSSMFIARWTNRSHIVLAGPFPSPDGSDMIAENLESFAIQLAKPSFDRHLPIGVQMEKATTNPTLTFSSYSGRGITGTSGYLYQNPAGHRAIHPLKVTIIVSLISQMKLFRLEIWSVKVPYARFASTNIAKRVKLLLISRAPQDDFSLRVRLWVLAIVPRKQQPWLQNPPDLIRC